MAASKEAKIIYCLVFDYCEFPVRPENYVHFFHFLGPSYGTKTVSLQTTKTIRDVKLQHRSVDSAPEFVDYEADLMLADLLELDHIYAVCIPGGYGTRSVSSTPSLGETLKRVIDKTEWVVTEALGSVLVAATGLLDGKRAVITRGGLRDAQGLYAAVKWESGPFFRPHGKIIHDGKFLTSDNLGRPAPLTEVSAATNTASFFRAVTEKDEDPIDSSFSQSAQLVRPETTHNTAISYVQLAELVTAIKREREDSHIIRMAQDVALRLACEGFVEDCNVIIAEILRHEPDLNFLLKRGLEMIWYTVGPRPDTPYPRPTDADLAAMEEEQRYYALRERSRTTISNLNNTPFEQLAPDEVAAFAKALAAVQHLEERKLISSAELGGGTRATSWNEGRITMPTEADERRGLAAFRNYLSRREEDDLPTDFRLVSVYANLALKYGFGEEGKQWLDLCLREELQSMYNMIGLSSLASGRYTSVELGAGAFQRLTGTPLEAATRAGQEIAAVLRERWQNGEEKPFASLPWPELLRLLQEAAHKAREKEDEDPALSEPYIYPYLHESATHSAMRAAEDRLGVTFPEDYKSFLTLSNGTGKPFAPSMEPPLALVEDIVWDEDTPRWAGLKVEPLPGVRGKEWDALPSLKRALRISMEGWDEYVYLIEPEMVGLLPGKEDAVRQGRWMVSTWASWRADHIPYDSFRDYMERLLVSLH